MDHRAVSFNTSRVGSLQARLCNEQLVDDVSDNVGEIETMQFSDDDCCWDDMPQGQHTSSQSIVPRERRASSRSLGETFFDQTTLPSDYTIIGPLKPFGSNLVLLTEVLQSNNSNDDDDDGDGDDDNDKNCHDNDETVIRDEHDDYSDV